MKFKNGDKVKIIKGAFANFIGECYVDDKDRRNAEVYIPENEEHTAFNVVVTCDMLEKIS